MDSIRFGRALRQWIALKDAEDLHNNVPTMLGRMALWIGLATVGLLSGLIARGIHPTHPAGEVIAGLLMLACLGACVCVIADALVTGYRLFDYENFRRKSIEKISRVAPELVARFEATAGQEFGLSVPSVRES